MVPTYTTSTRNRARRCSGLGGQYTSTDSAIRQLVQQGFVGRGPAASDRTPGRRQHQERLRRTILGTGVPLKTNDELRALVGRYLHRVYGELVRRRPRDVHQLPAARGVGVRRPGARTSSACRGSNREASARRSIMTRATTRTARSRALLVNLNNHRPTATGSAGSKQLRRLPRGWPRLLLGTAQAIVLAPCASFNQCDCGRAASQPMHPCQLRGYKLGQYTGNSTCPRSKSRSD
jgi:hypothetical protein